MMYDIRDLDPSGMSTNKLHDTATIDFCFLLFIIRDYIYAYVQV